MHRIIMSAYLDREDSPTEQEDERDGDTPANGSVGRETIQIVLVVLKRKRLYESLSI
jgi:hypothetical protein